MFFNINICRTNLEDVKQLTEIAHDHGIITDYHINESPMIEQEPLQARGRKRRLSFDLKIFSEVDALIDWLIEKNRGGYKMVNSIQRLSEMKDFLRGKVKPWNCRAGQNSLIIRVDGSLAPCFPMYSATYDWGAIRESQVRGGAAGRDETVLPDPLLFNLESQSLATVTTTFVSFAGLSGKRHTRFGSRWGASTSYATLHPEAETHSR